jgi:hypothetical protein
VANAFQQSLERANPVSKEVEVVGVERRPDLGGDRGEVAQRSDTLSLAPGRGEVERFVER